MRLILCISLILLTPLFLSCNKELKDEVQNEPWDKIITTVITQKDIVWVGTQKNGLYKLEGESWLNYTDSDGLPSNYISSILIDKKENLWIGTNLGISKFENGNWTSLTEIEGLYNNNIRSLACDQLNNIWIGSVRNRIVKYDGTNFINYHVNSETSGDPGIGHIHAITFDHDDNIWIGSCMTGLSKFDGINWEHKVNALGNFIEKSICTKDGNLWVGHYMGLYNYSNGVWTKYTKDNGLVDHVILSLDFDQQNNVWVGTENGISKFDGTTWTNYTIDNKLINVYVSSLSCGQDGAIWVGNSEGLIKYNPN